MTQSMPLRVVRALIHVVLILGAVALAITLMTMVADEAVKEPRPPPLDPELTLGSAGAGIVIVEFGDFNCHWCGVHHDQVEGALIDKYVDTGKIRLVWRDFPKLGRDSVRTAVAARAAARQGRFWDFHDALFEAEGGADTKLLRKTAKRIGLDLDRFDSDRKDPEVRAAVDADHQYARELNIAGTPAFQINDGVPLFGAQPLEVFERTIERRLAEMRD